MFKIKPGTKVPDFSLPMTGGCKRFDAIKWRNVKLPGHAEQVLEAAQRL